MRRLSAALAPLHRPRVREGRTVKLTHQGPVLPLTHADAIPPEEYRRANTATAHYFIDGASAAPLLPSLLNECRDSLVGESLAAAAKPRRWSMSGQY